MAFNYSLMYAYTYEVPVDILYEKAVRAARRAIELDPQNAEAYIALGRADLVRTPLAGGQKAANRAYEQLPTMRSGRLLVTI
jgi:cytochrome c-type biogenesis protein CcmH/NrfG